jgi:hypothetical protein
MGDAVIAKRVTTASEMIATIANSTKSSELDTDSSYFIILKLYFTGYAITEIGELEVIRTMPVIELRQLP